MPQKPQWSLAGWGGWKAHRDGESEKPGVAFQDFMHTCTWGGGEGWFAPLAGTHVSSTRAEIAGLIAALHVPSPVRIGIDNAA
eukprot:13272870-Alexandrium_andersonii.AAC.1